MTRFAASLALVLAVQPRTSPVPHADPTPAAPPLVAMLGDEKADESRRQLGSRAAGSCSRCRRHAADPSHAHELWVIPGDGKPRSLGTMGDGKQMHMRLEEALAELMHQGATIAISVEPPGGSPTGAPTGPVIASGTLRTA